MKNDPRRSFWRAAGPLLGFWGIQLVMEFVIEFIIILPFMGEASSRMTQSGEVLNYQEMMNKYYEVLSPAFDKIIGGQIAIAGSSNVVSDSYIVCYRSKERADCRDTADGGSKATEELLVTSCDGSDRKYWCYMSVRYGTGCFG